MSIKPVTPACPLCREKNSGFFFKDGDRPYYQCNTCELVFVPRDFFLTAEKEKAEYDLHENNPADERYRTFLGRLFHPLNERLKPGSSGLDFGCGPGPALSIMFKEAGHKTAVYDKFYANDSEALNRTYDFITATEVVEHLHDPGKTLDLIWSRLKAGGWLGIMTKMVMDQQAFSNWHYKNDLTHVCFFSKSCFLRLAKAFNAKIRFFHNDVVLMQK